MTRPGVEILSRAQPVPRSAPTDIGTGFLVGEVAVPPTAPEYPGYSLLRSITQFDDTFGGPTAAGVTRQSADAFFREGGSRLYVAPLVPSGGLRAGNGNGGEGETSKGTKSADTRVLDPAISGGVGNALAALTKDLGPGQVFLADPSYSEDAALGASMLAHAQECNRIALLGFGTNTSAAALAALAAALTSDANARYGAVFAPSIRTPVTASAAAPGDTASIPASAIEAGIMARNDVSFNPNVAAAGDNGLSVFGIDVGARYTDAEYETLNEAGVNMFRLLYNGVTAYGYRTLADPATQAAAWLSLGNARLNMAIVTRAEAVAERFVFTQIDGRRRSISQFGGELRAMLVPFYEAGALYGATAADAFDVNVGEQVNTEETIANGELHAVIQVRMSPFAEKVVIEIVKVATTQVLAAA